MGLYRFQAAFLLCHISIIIRITLSALSLVCGRVERVNF